MHCFALDCIAHNASWVGMGETNMRAKIGTARLAAD